MHVTDPEPLPEIDTGLPVVRWKAPGFVQMRESALLDPKRQFELVDGLVLHRHCGSPRHDAVVAQLVDRLRAADASMDVRTDFELVLDDLDAVVSPDVSVWDRSPTPSLVVEVSDDAPRLDAQEKARLYARAGVATYWHIDLAWTMLYAHTRPHGDEYGLRSTGPTCEPAPTWFAPMPDLVLDDLLASSSL